MQGIAASALSSMSKFHAIWFLIFQLVVQVQSFQLLKLIFKFKCLNVLAGFGGQWWAPDFMKKLSLEIFYSSKSKGLFPSCNIFEVSEMVVKLDLVKKLFCCLPKVTALRDEMSHWLASAQKVSCLLCALPLLYICLSVEMPWVFHLTFPLCVFGP